MIKTNEDRELCLEQKLPEPSIREEESEISLEMIDQAVKELWHELTSEMVMSKKVSLDPTSLKGTLHV